MSVQLLHATSSHRPGAIAILQLLGDSTEVLRELTGLEHWPLHRVRLANFGGIDEGLAVRIAPRFAQLMPHGGPRIIQQLSARLRELGVQPFQERSVRDALSLFPEAHDEIEARMLMTLSDAQSPLAIDLLLQQPSLWREIQAGKRTFTDRDDARSQRLRHLLIPPLVVLAGKPNVGKSTLSNALLGRTMSIAMDMPGTTRDYIAARIDLAGLVVDWHDTPGIRGGDDPIEAKASQLAATLMRDADLLIAMCDQTHDWPKLPRQPDLLVINKCDIPPGTPKAIEAAHQEPLRISALSGFGISELVSAIRQAIIPWEDLEACRPWRFDDHVEPSGSN